MASNSLSDAQSVGPPQRLYNRWRKRLMLTRCLIADKNEFTKMSTAVGFGFIIMGATGFIIKLSTCLKSILRWDHY
jgi:preprotein translocase subunit Sss1